jgi:hypothetical protein
MDGLSVNFMEGGWDMNRHILSVFRQFWGPAKCERLPGENYNYFMKLLFLQSVGKLLVSNPTYKK